MDFDFNDEQRLLDETVRRFVANEYDASKRKAWLAERDGFSREMWRRHGELGLLGLPLPEAHGGFGGSAVEVMIVMESLGRGLLLEPYLESVVLGGALISLAGNDAQRAKLLPELAAGNLLLAFAHGERQARYRLSHVETKARRDGDHYVLDGYKSVVSHGESADKLIISARSAGGAAAVDGISLFLIDRDTSGLKLRDYPTIDERRAAEVTLDGVRASAAAMLGAPDAAFPIIEHVVDRAIAALCAEAVGIMDEINRTTLDYLKLRKQFGVPIGSFQALQHRMVDMTIAQEQAKSMAILAALSADLTDRSERRRAISAAKVRIGRAGRFIGEQAIQLHGGIGMTDDYVIGHYFKRLIMIDRSFGDVDHHLDAFAAETLPEA